VRPLRTGSARYGLCRREIAAALSACAAILCLLLIPVSPGAAATTEGRPVVRLGRVNVLSGSASGYLLVRLEQAAVLDFSAFAATKDGFGRLDRRGGPTPAIDIDGGTFAGFMLTDETVKQSGPVVMAGTFDRCSEGCDEADVVNFSYPISSGRTIRLAAGDYRLYLIANGGRARVEFRFARGPAGTTRLRPSTSSHSDASAWVADELGRTALSRTHPHDTYSDAFSLTAMVVEGTYAAEGMGVCTNSADLPSGQVCGPWGGNTFNRINAGPVGGRESTFVLFSAQLGLAPGAWRLGAWYANPTSAERLAVLTLTVDYERGGPPA
jgi:hypothetical protein